MSEHTSELAGRELDVAVAEHVMGFVVGKVKPDWYPLEVTLFGFPLMPERIAYSLDANGCNAMMFRNGVDERAGFADPLPSYSEDLAATMEVVEKMRADGWSFACTLYEGKLPYASFCKGTAASSRNAEAESLPEAICRAALIAARMKEQAAESDEEDVVGTPV